MITTLNIENFKGFQSYSIPFQRLNLLVGGNNSGKTSVFHALQLFFWCVDRTADIDEASVTFRKTQVAEIDAVPYYETKDLYYQQRTRAGRTPTRIKVEVATDEAEPLSFAVYPAFSRNLMIDGADKTISRTAFDSLRTLKPVYVPGMIGITVREDLYRPIAQERLILEGRQNQVLRNLVWRIKQGDEWERFVDLVKPLFRLDGLSVPFDESRDEWLTALYREAGCEFDLVSAGSGFLQVVNLLSFLFLHPAHVALLDEPDSHMHEDLQRLTFDLLDKISLTRKVQLLIATHSPTMIDSAGLDSVCLIDKNFGEPLRPKDVESLVLCHS